MTDPAQQPQSYRVVRITEDDIANPAHLERLFAPLYMIVEPIVDLSGVQVLVEAVAGHLKHLNRYHTSKGSERLRIVADSSSVRHVLNGGANVFRLYDTVEEALTTI